jgi:hypothetical protein
MDRRRANSNLLSVGRIVNPASKINSILRPFADRLRINLVACIEAVPMQHPVAIESDQLASVWTDRIECDYALIANHLRNLGTMKVDKVCQRLVAIT